MAGYGAILANGSEKNRCAPTQSIDRPSHAYQSVAPRLRACQPRRARIDPHIQPVNLVLGDVVCEAGGFLEYVYFPKGAVLSLLTVLANGAAIETANIGNEGAFGLFAAMYSRTSFNQCLVQLQGGLVRVPIEILRMEFERSDHMRNLLVSYSETQLAQVQQTAACNSMHTIEQRLCRWLLMMHDRAETEELSYTHEFLAHMLWV